jgi:hypothetical protein
VTNHYSRAQDLINDAAQKVELTRGAAKVGYDVTPQLLSALITAVSAVAHAQLAAIDAATRVSAPLSEIVSSASGETEPRWYPSDNEPAKHVASLEYHSRDPLHEFLHRQSDGGWLWSTEQVSTKIRGREGLGWGIITQGRTGYFTEVKR